jgi:hypothetical protein
MDVSDLMRQCNGKAPPPKALVKGLARELDITESFLDKLAEEVRKDLGPKGYSTNSGDWSGSQQEISVRTNGSGNS